MSLQKMLCRSYSLSVSWLPCLLHLFADSRCGARLSLLYRLRRAFMIPRPVTYQTVKSPGSDRYSLMVTISKYRHDEVPVYGPLHMAGYGVEMIPCMEYHAPGYDCRVVLTVLCFFP